MLIDGNALAKQVENELKEKLAKVVLNRKPCLSVILVGNHPPSVIYVKRKREACARLGIESILISLPQDVPENRLKNEICKLNDQQNVDGILIQLPLPPQIDVTNIINQISPKKDVDGLHPQNVGKMLLGDPTGYLPCTPYGIQTMLYRSGINLSGKHTLILGRSNLVGKPMAAILMQNSPMGNATVTIAHSKSQHIKKLCLSADILIAAIGQPFFVKEDMVKEGTIVIDVGINKIEDPLQKKGYRIVGDVDFVHIEKKCAFITPVPGGVGPMTIAMLLSNTVKSFIQSI